MAESLAAVDSTVESVVDTIGQAAPEIRQGLVGRRAAVEEQNPSGEMQLEADVWADQLLAERLTAIDGVAQYGTEERPTVLECGDIETGVAVALDPLDGSSNLRSNNAVGTIFGIYDEPLPARGRDLVAAGYVLYGPVITMILATDAGVTEYELTDDGRYVITADVGISENPVVYGVGGRVQNWVPEIEAYVRSIETELKLRYGGAMIADVNQVLTYGGLFSYPTLEHRPEGKLRLQFECNPIAYVIERAGGASSNGQKSILSVEPTDVHQRTPLYVGNDEYVERLESALA